MDPEWICLGTGTHEHRQSLSGREMDGLARAWVSVSGTRCAGVGAQEEKLCVNGQHNLKSERQTSVHEYGASPTTTTFKLSPPLRRDSESQRNTRKPNVRRTQGHKSRRRQCVSTTLQGDDIIGHRCVASECHFQPHEGYPLLSAQSFR